MTKQPKRVITSISIPRELMCRIDLVRDRLGEVGPKPSRNAMIGHMLQEHLTLIDAPHYEPAPAPKTVRRSGTRVRTRPNTEQAA